MIIIVNLDLYYLGIRLRLGPGSSVTGEVLLNGTLGREPTSTEPLCPDFSASGKQSQVAVGYSAQFSGFSKGD